MDKLLWETGDNIVASEELLNDIKVHLEIIYDKMPSGRTGCSCLPFHFTERRTASAVCVLANYVKINEIITSCTKSITQFTFYSRMPVQYVLGEWDFQDLTLKMKPPVFIPRPETEASY